MITVKSPKEIDIMRKAGRITADALSLMCDMVKPGMTTRQLDKIGHEYIVKQNATPSFLGYGGFPACCCISVNEQVIHGIPADRVLKEGDIVSVDCGSIFNGYHSDAARTFAVGNISAENQQLIDVTEKSFFEGMKNIKAGSRLGDIGGAIQEFVESNGFSVVRQYVGHGIGRNLHEDPAIPNYGKCGTGVRLKAGMTLAVEPMVNAGVYDVKVLADEWTVVTLDGKNSAHYENTVLITENGVEILTL